MAEIKNNFLGSKMNKDVDDRLLPPNEYREAFNVQINTSEGSDTGTLQNVLGNELIQNADFNYLEGISGNTPRLKCIGTLVDNSNDNIYFFLTNYTNPPGNYVYNQTAINCIYVYNTKTNAYRKLVSGPFLNFSTTNPILGVNIIEDLLFFTDNRNQPRKINVARAYNSSTYYTTEDQISVAKISPLYPLELYKVRTVAPASGSYECTMYDVQSEFYPDGTPDTAHYQANYPGDPSYLSSRMVRFSYRYKFDDGEYSILAPFTQIAYIPKQDGFFLNSDEEEALRSTIVKFMQNKVNNILLQMILPCPANELANKFKITEVDIIYKESDSPMVSVVDSITVENIATKSGASQVYEYNYQSKKPFKTLPERDLIRVYDKVPLKALAQEVVSNRVVYGNYQDKATYPKYLNYNVGYSIKSAFGFTAGKGTSIIEYPNHTLKQNRNYQVGVVLCDKFGRQSGVILSDSFDSTSSLFRASSLYVPYFSNTTNKKDWPGLSLKILFNSPISSAAPNAGTGWPGLYNGNPNDPAYNPNGWYSYKIVVKQTEQDYYNVYVPGVMNAYPEDATLEIGKTAHTVLINDNINKVPRDLKEVGPTQTQFRSSVLLYGRVNNTSTGNTQFYPGNTYSFVNTIATNASLFGVDQATLDPVYDKFYQINSNPLIARLSTTIPVGVTSANTVKNLAVFETKPVDSKLDIYWEASTAGLISVLNEAILSDDGGAAYIDGFTFTLFEDTSNAVIVADNFSFKDLSGAPVIPSSIPSLSVTNIYGQSRTSKFTLENGSSAGSYRIRTNGYFYFGPDAANLESYTFAFSVTAGPLNVVNTINGFGQLQNRYPTITSTTTMLEFTSPVVNVYQFTGNNGSNVLGGRSTDDLGWTIVSQESESNGQWFPTTIFSIASGGMLQELNSIAVGLYRVKVRLTDAGGLTDEHTIMIQYTPPFTYNCVPLQGGCQVVPDQSGQYATLEECEGACIVCRSYDMVCNANPGLQCQYGWRDCITNESKTNTFSAGSTAAISCARVGSQYSTSGNVTFTAAEYCQS